MLYKATPAPTIVSVPRMNYLTIAGAGLPSDAAYQDALRDLHKMAHTIRMNIVRMEGYYDFVPPPLETIWSKGSSLGESDEDPWHWTCLIRVPDFVTVSALCNIMVYYKHFLDGNMNLEDRRAYDAVQALHVGTRSDYTTRQAILDWIGENKLKLSSPHETGAHEIYLSDPKKTETSKLKTIVRVPVEL